MTYGHEGLQRKTDRERKKEIMREKERDRERDRARARARKTDRRREMPEKELGRRNMVKRDIKGVEND